MEQSNQSKRVLLSVIGVAILVVAVVGVSFAFFNYTRTGATNSVGTGKIKFVANGAGNVNLSNLFPITSTAYNSELTAIDGGGTYSASTNHFARIVVTLSGETTYPQGMDFRVTAQEVNATATSGTSVNIPITIKVYETDTTAAANKLTNDSITGYDFTATTSSTLTTGYVFADGHIDATSSVDAFVGNRFSAQVIIDAYIDGDKMFITDTPAESAELTTGKTVVTTDQWNALASQNISFKVRVDSTETGTTGAYVDDTSYVVSNS